MLYLSFFYWFLLTQFVREWVATNTTALEEHVACLFHCTFNGTTFHDTLCAIFLGKCVFSAISADLMHIYAMSMIWWTDYWYLFEPFLFILLHPSTQIWQQLFAIVPLNWDEWMAVLWISAPVILLDEILKIISRFVVEKDKRIKLDWRDTNCLECTYITNKREKKKIKLNNISHFSLCYYFLLRPSIFHSPHPFHFSWTIILQ